MRGVRQLGLAHLVFPGAVHDRLEHAIGVVGAAEQVIGALNRQIDRWNTGKDSADQPLERVSDEDRFRLRLAAIFHDLGHGPFSHAIEPVLEVASPLGGETSTSADGWRADIIAARNALKGTYRLNASPAVSEIIAVMIILSEPVKTLLSNDKLNIPRKADIESLQEQLVACVIGAVEGPGADHLSTVISGQLDADRMDFLARDAHHSGLKIGFDTDRLLSRLEILQVRDDNTPNADEALRQRIADRSPHPVLQIGIAASGFGSFEQMLIGRTFLYDRLYHHHKVRAAEAMAQRMLLVAERDRGKRLDLKEIFLPVGDDTLLNILSMNVSHSDFETASKPAALLARGILERKLLHRAFAFRSRFVAVPAEVGPEAAESIRDEQWRRILKSLDTLSDRYDLGTRIYTFASQSLDVLCETGEDEERDRLESISESLRRLGPEHVIVDLPRRKADAIRILARYPDGSLKVPEFSFNPVKWADAYDLQKRTGFVFAPREVLPIIALAAKVVFLTEFGVVMNGDADGYIKAGQTIGEKWLGQLAEKGVIDKEVAVQLETRRESLLSLQRDDLEIPTGWATENPELPYTLLARLKKGIKGGLTYEALQGFRTTMAAMFAFVDMWYDGNEIVSDVKDEADFQERLTRHFRSRSVPVEEGTVVGGGKLDLFAADAVLIENKYVGSETAEPANAAPSAGAQGRRYAIALQSQIVLSVAAVQLKKGEEPPQRSDMVEVRESNTADKNRTEIRFTVPYGASVPSAQKPQ
ncbi:MAG: HD domain-containing protein [Aliishimia sp.]